MAARHGDSGDANADRSTRVPSVLALQLVVRLQPDEAIYLKLVVKKPGEVCCLSALSFPLMCNTR